jgi:hypothetical protein
MRFRTPSIVAAIAGLTGSLLMATPAQAATHYSKLDTSRIAINSSGHGQVPLKCGHSSKSCKGSIWFTDDAGTPRKRSYTVPARSTRWVKVSINKSASDNPHNAAKVAGRDIRSVKNVRVTVKQTAPGRVTRTFKSITTETRLSRQQITGTVTGVGGARATDIRVELLKAIRGGNLQVVKGDNVTSNGGRFTMSVALGKNNGSSDSYRLRISGTDAEGQRRSWYWRGKDDKPAGAGSGFYEGSVVRATRLENFNANFRYGNISGTTSAGAEVTVAAAPPSYGGNAAALRELDIARCANVYGRTRARSNGRYVVGFLPLTTSAATRYMVSVTKGSTRAWYGRTSTRYGSCYDITEYNYRKRNLITLSAPLVKNLSTAASNNRVSVKARYKGFTPTGQGDRWIRIREKVPGGKVLDGRVVAEGIASSSGRRTFNHVPPGNYWVESGRRTGCSDWYPSKFANNRSYFRGSDRSGERWKAFRRVSELRGGKTSGHEGMARRAQPNPATNAQDKVKRGYKGWMYRAHCKALGAGTIDSIRVSGTGDRVSKTTSTNRKGAVVSGRVTVEGGKTNVEMMVRLTSSDGKRVLRTDLTDGSGRFYVAGLTSGTWKVSVNSDSWRGISRKFTGRKKIKVKAGKNYSIGTLRLR